MGVNLQIKIDNTDLLFKTENGIDNIPLRCFKALNISHIDSILALQAKLDNDNTIMRDVSYLAHHFNVGHSAIGIFDGAKLIGQALLTQDQLKICEKMQPYKKAERSSSLSQSTIGMFMVDSDYRGQGLANQLLKVWEIHAKQADIDILHARVKLSNQHAYKCFSGFGMQDVKHGPSPDDETRLVSYMYKAM